MEIVWGVGYLLLAEQCVLLVEDIEDVDCDMVTDYDTYLTFDDNLVKRTPPDFDDRGVKIQMLIPYTVRPRP